MLLYSNIGAELHDKIYALNIAAFKASPPIPLERFIF